MGGDFIDIEFVQKNWHLFLALVVILALLFMEPIRQRMGGVRSVSALELPQLLSHDSAIVVDVSEAGEFKNGRVPNSVNVPLSELKDSLKKLEKHKGKPIVVACRTGNRSARAASILRRSNFENVYTLSGGVAAWQKENFPIER